MSIEQEQRAAVIAEARSWMGTPWRHRANVKGQAVDCAMLMRECFVRTGVLAPFEVPPYPKSWFMHRQEEWLLEWVLKLGGRELPLEKATPGDLLMYKYGHCYGHLGLLVAPQRIIHAYARNGQVIETETFDTELAKRGPRAFTMWGAA
jgi:NlpC/P60 family putative phage cell wall peptidase